MSQQTLVPEEIKKKIGVEGKPRIYEIEKGLIRRFADAIGDPNPLWTDESYTSKTRFGSLSVPLALVIALGWEDFQDEGPRTDIPNIAGLHGGTELEWYLPVKTGDVITITNTLVSARERDSQRLGKMAFLNYERVYKNQRSELVAKCRQLVIIYRPEVKHG